MTIKIKRLLKRRDFLRVGSSRKKFIVRSMVIQYHKLAEDLRDNSTINIGFTVTKKQGNAVIRNRIKRRLREASNAIFPTAGNPHYEYVIIGRKESLNKSFEQLKQDMLFALSHIHKK